MGSEEKEYLATAKGFIEQLEHLRDAYSDEIPTRLISGKFTHMKATHKVQRNWWAMLILTLDFMEIKLEIHEELRVLVRSFIQVYTADDFIYKEKTDQLDICNANTVIKASIEALLQLEKTTSQSSSEEVESGLDCVPKVSSSSEY